ncbi:MAG: AlpA family phage regulatory protein [Woeseiaceae bacterium]|nr:AlpA family phage regulatory protein [Woeseiaceae bacterium]
MQNKILRLPAVVTQCGLSRSTIYSRISDGLWPKGVNLGPRAVGWPLNEVIALNNARIAGKSDEKIRALVAKIEATRKAPLSDSQNHGGS